MEAIFNLQTILRQESYKVKSRKRLNNLGGYITLPRGLPYD